MEAGSSDAATGRCSTPSRRLTRWCGRAPGHFGLANELPSFVRMRGGLRRGAVEAEGPAFFFGLPVHAPRVRPEVGEETTTAKPSLPAHAAH